MKITFIIPTLNEEEGIGPTIDAIDRDAFAASGHTVEVLVVDGNSKDRTAAEAKKRGAKVIVEKRRGYGRAYKVGFAKADGDIFVTGDADGTYPFEKAHEYVQTLVDGGYDFLTCNRYADLKEGAMSPKHKLGNWVLSTTARVLFWIGLKDSQSGMWIIRRDALSQIPYDGFGEGMPFSQEIKIDALKRKSIKAAEIPGSLHPRIGEAVIESWTDGFGNLGALFRKRFTTRWSRRA